MVRALSGGASHAARLAAQLLSGPPARDAVAVAERLLAVQAQDPRGARLAIRARTLGSGLTAAGVDGALTADRALVVSWLNRGTLHLVRSEDWPWLHALTAPPHATAIARRLAQDGVTPEATARAVTAVERALTAEGALTREQLRERIDAAGVRTAGQALVHLLAAAAVRGVVVRGPMLGARHGWVLVREWLGEEALAARTAAAAGEGRERALAELARRYLAGHGPASDRDLARWAGLALRDARAGLAAIAGELVEAAGGGADGAAADRGEASGRPAAGAGASRAGADRERLVDLARRPAGPAAQAELPPPRLLGAFDPLLLGWVSREPVVGRHRDVVTVNGLFRPFALVGGRAAALWSYAGRRVALEPFGRLARADRAALEADADDVRRFLGDA